MWVGLVREFSVENPRLDTEHQTLWSSAAPTASQLIPLTVSRFKERTVIGEGDPLK